MKAAGLLSLAFAVRLAFGLTSEFWGVDQVQIYLIGLKYYTTGLWPMFGPDVVYTHTQIPGGLQGLLVGGPLFLIAQPETPYVLLNVLSLGALSLLAWYIGQRLPNVPKWFLWTWILTAPWTLDLSTGIVNPSYVLTGSAIFFVCAFELLPGLQRRLLPRSIAFLGLGFGILWVYQLHLSYPLMLPFAAVAVLASARRGVRPLMSGLGCLLAGAVIAGSTLVPTLVHFGVDGLTAGTNANVAFSPANLLNLPIIALRFFSFGSFELPRFIGPDTASRLTFLTTHPWAAPFAVIASLCGSVQVILMIVGLFWRHSQPQWPAIRTVTLALLALVWMSFMFSVKDPASHAFYIVLPVVMLYSFYIWEPLLKMRAGRIAAGVLLACGAITHVAIAIDSLQRTSLYTNRNAVESAIRTKDYHLVGERRSDR